MYTNKHRSSTPAYLFVYQIVYQPVHLSFHPPTYPRYIRQHVYLYFHSTCPHEYVYLHTNLTILNYLVCFVIHLLYFNLLLVSLFNHTIIRFSRASVRHFLRTAGKNLHIERIFYFVGL